LDVAVVTITGMQPICRYAPSTTGRAHPGTLLAGLLAWLDARARGACFILRLENLDSERSSPEKMAAMEDDLRWLGLDWDRLERQSEHTARHDAAMDWLHALQRIYPCACSRTRIRQAAIQALDGGWVYPGFCRGRSVAHWRGCGEALRCDLTDQRPVVRDESGLDLSQDIAACMGDPIVMRKDQTAAYQLAVVVDDAAAGVTRVIRGRDLAPSTATQVALGSLLGFEVPVYRHHFLLLEAHGAKFAKVHGSVGADVLRTCYTASALCGWLAWVAGLQASPRACLPRDLVNVFDWGRVRKEDQLLHWDGRTLRRG
jgi:glutamyl/glutaminyl-tRNA synthetase